MTVFWIVAALLAIGALLFVLPPLLRPKADTVNSGGVNVAVHRDQLREAERDLANDLITPERFEQARAEIQSRVLEDTAATGPAALAVRPARGVAIALALLIPLGSVVVYQRVGNPAALTPQAQAAATAGAEPGHSITPEQIEKMVGTLAERLKAEPNNAEGWFMLGRSYTALGRYPEAAAAMRRAVELTPPDPSLLADFADVLGMAQGKRLAGEPARLVQQALALDPRHGKALALAGSVAFEAKDYAGARRYWERLAAVVPPDSPMAQSVQQSIAEATALASGRELAAAGPTPPTAAAPASAVSTAKLTGTVQLSPALAARVAAGDTLFVFARAVEGPRMPLAIVRRNATLPFEFTLDDSMAMTPATRLSGATRVFVGARVSKSGNATPQAGDLVGQSEPVAAAASGVRVTIDRVQP